SPARPELLATRKARSYAASHRPRTRGLSATSRIAAHRLEESGTVHHGGRSGNAARAGRSGGRAGGAEARWRGHEAAYEQGGARGRRIRNRSGGIERCFGAAGKRIAAQSQSSRVVLLRRAEREGDRGRFERRRDVNFAADGRK